MISPSRRNAVLGFSLLAVYFAASVATLYDPDLFHCLSLGREFLRTGHLPTVDVFAYTPTRVPVVHHEWAWSTLLYVVVTKTGATGLLVLKYVLEVGIVAGTLLLARRQGAQLPTLCFLGPMGIVLIAPGLTTLRAQVPTLLFTVILLWLLDLDRRGARWWVLAYLPLHVLWLNCHGGFVVGSGLLALHTAEQFIARRSVGHLLAALGLSVVLVAANPYGFAYYEYLAYGLRMDRSLILEWRPLWEGRFGMPVWLVSVVVLVYGMWKVGPRGAAGWLLTAGAALMALRFQRHVSIYGVVWLAQMPPLVQRARLGEVFHQLWSARPEYTTAALLLALAWGGFRVARVRPWHLVLPSNPGETDVVVYPVGAADYLGRVGFRGNVLVPFEVGAFISWKLHPEVKVSIDGRYEAAYQPSLLVEHIEFYQASARWREVLSRYATDAVLVPSSQPVEQALRRDGTWSLVYEDDGYQLYARPGLRLPAVDRRGAHLVGTFP